MHLLKTNLKTQGYNLKICSKSNYIRNTKVKARIIKTKITRNKLTCYIKSSLKKVTGGNTFEVLVLYYGHIIILLLLLLKLQKTNKISAAELCFFFFSLPLIISQSLRFSL